MLNISVLLEDCDAPGFGCEHGLSLLLESGDAVILFDTGESGVFTQNAEKMGLDLGRVTEIVISHGHHDHGNGLAEGLPYIARKKGMRDLPPLVAHPEITLPRRVFVGVSADCPEGWVDVGINQLSLMELQKWPSRFSRTPLWLRENIAFLGEIPQKYPHLSVRLGETPTGPDGAFEPDRLADDTALAFVTPKGLIIVAGCSHSGVVNIVEQARAVTGLNKVHALFGGLHFRDMAPAAIEQSINYLRGLELAEVWAAHCTEHDLAGLPNQIKLKTGETHRIEF